MTLSSLAFLLGITAVQQLRVLPGGGALLLVAILLASAVWKRYWPLAALLGGILWTCGLGAWYLQDSLGTDYQQRSMLIKGYISSLPQRRGDKLDFEFKVLEPPPSCPGKLHLSWFSPKFDLKAGQIWQLNVKLKAPYDRLNPGSFNHETWLFANHIGATGRVNPQPAPVLLGEKPGLAALFANLRQTIATRLEQALPEHEQLGLLKALSIGSQDGISQNQWQVFRRTGTTHLVVISGSHISLVAGLVFLAVRRAWARWGTLQIAPQRAAAACAWLSALVYAGLAGFSIPTSRAVIMLSVALAALAGQRHVSAWRILLLALLTVLVFEPLAVLAAGFWLSFVAVALLIYISAGRLGRAGFWHEASMPQLAAALGLAPFLIVFFQQVSLIAPLANWLAVPVIGLLVVPLALLAVIMLFILPAAAAWLLQCLALLLDWLWHILEKLAELPWATLYCPTPSWYALPFAGLGILLLLAPRGVPGRYLGGALLLPLFWVKLDKPEPNQAWLTLLDVGQGLAVVVETRQHALVFDTGSRFSPEFDMGTAVLVPFLHNRAITTLDSLIISHDDLDHSGGAAALLAEIPAAEVLSSARRWAERSNSNYCWAGQVWSWDGVQFQMLGPPQPGFTKENNNSCVLRISTASQSFLLTGDIEKPAESWLVSQYGPELHSSILIAPHHGSNSSSSYDFLQQVAPQLVLIPAGYLNRFGFPHQQVLNTYRLLNLPWLNTALVGAISVHTGNEDLQISSAWQEHQRYWLSGRLDWNGETAGDSAD
ncbi:DNA internalization-related competence protein ComEC/Rec2 [Methylomonas paludis]|uniref:DNA internalization-related competence protein ComEC/Rec2 n=1 Tax=Methylomonas paludis TaxID=1173101 RepID=A0A975R9D7_9GAMM|nr:DNA internalization-related competence protein ComEC/Rec2 [Methylomonas paludis]QWF70129.1 DNA internalization-related competence protein ComEC/Rec2 [Methylomonas paludis]